MFSAGYNYTVNSHIEPIQVPKEFKEKVITE